MRAVRAILYATFEGTWLPHLTEEAARAYRDEDRPGRYIAERGQCFWVAVIDGDIVGFVDWDTNFVNALHVRPCHIRRGVGTCLMNAAESEIGRAGHAAVKLETDTFNVDSQAFYAARGYEEVDRYPDQEWNSGLVTLRLSKRLA
jgi:GNAT superfamily N-acetyltransferase